MEKPEDKTNWSQSKGEYKIIKAKINRSKTRSVKQNQWSAKLVLRKDQYNWQTSGLLDRYRKENDTNHPMSAGNRELLL